MKKIFSLFMLIALLISSASYGQTAKGNILLGISPVIGISSRSADMAFIGFTNVKYTGGDQGDEDGESTIFFGVVPKVGYFFKDNLALGLDINFSYDLIKYNNENDAKSSLSNLAAGPFIRYYFPLSKVTPFLELNSLFGQAKFKIEDDNQESKSKRNVTSLGAGAGLAFPLSEIVTFDFFVGYNSTRYKYPNDKENKTVMGTVLLRFGVAVFLGQKMQ